MFKLSERQKLGLMVAGFAGVVGLILIAYFHFMIGRGMIKDFERQTVNMKKEMVDLDKQIAQINVIVGQEAEIKKQAEMISMITRRLPSSPDAPGFLNALVSILGTTGIFNEETKPAAIVENSPLYREIPYRVKANGHYHAFGQFLTLVEQNPDRFMRVKNLKITNNISRPSVHPIVLEIATFMFKKQ